MNPLPEPALVHGPAMLPATKHPMNEFIPCWPTKLQRWLMPWLFAKVGTTQQVSIMLLVSSACSASAVRLSRTPTPPTFIGMTETLSFLSATASASVDTSASAPFCSLGGC